jgi:acyl-CoA dehydrogenase
MRRLIFDSEHDLFRDVARRFFRQEVAPHAERWRAQGHVDREIYRTCGSHGLLCTWAAEAYGGAANPDFRYSQIVIEENVTHGEAGFYIGLHANLVAPYLDDLGSPEQKQRFLPRVVSGETILAIAMTEPAAGSDLAGMRTRATRAGDHWVLNGSKTFISNGQIADLIVVAARTSDAPRDLGLFLVEPGMPGFARGGILRKMGLAAQDTSDLFFDDVAIPPDNVLGDPFKGFAYLTGHLPCERLVAAIGALAAAQLAFDLTLAFVRERRAFGRPIGAYQNTRFTLADLRTELDCAQTFVDQLVLLYNDGGLSGQLAAEAKLLATELEGRVTDAGVQLHGGSGYMEACRIARLYTDARASRIFAGTNEIMREIIGRGLGLDDRKLE